MCLSEPLESFEEARRSALEQLLAGLTGGSAVAAAEAFARGERCLRVVHGDPDSPQEARRIDSLAAMAEQVVLEVDAPGQWLRTVGTNDTSTFWFAGSEQVDADFLVAALAARVLAIAPPWWRLSEDPA